MLGWVNVVAACAERPCRVPGERFLDERDPHLVGVGRPGSPRQARVGADGQMVVDVDVVPATEPPEPTGEHAFVPGRSDAVR